MSIAFHISLHPGSYIRRRRNSRFCPLTHDACLQRQLYLFISQIWIPDKNPISQNVRNRLCHVFKSVGNGVAGECQSASRYLFKNHPALLCRFCGKAVTLQSRYNFTCCYHVSKSLNRHCYFHSRAALTFQGPHASSPSLPAGRRIRNLEQLPKV